MLPQQSELMNQKFRFGKFIGISFLLLVIQQIIISVVALLLALPWAAWVLNVLSISVATFVVALIFTRKNWVLMGFAGLGIFYAVSMILWYLIAFLTTSYASMVISGIIGALATGALFTLKK